MNDDINLETLVDLLDKAMSSEDPIIKDQLRKLLMVVALTNTGNASEKIDGPLSAVFNDFAKLQATVNALTRKVDAFSGNYNAIEKAKIDDEALKVRYEAIGIDEFTDKYYASTYGSGSNSWIKKLRNGDY